MSTAADKLCLLLVVMFAHDHCACAPAGRDLPRFRLANGTVLEDSAKIDFKCGSSLELFCTGHARDLRVTSHYGDVVPTTTINETTIRLFVEKLSDLPELIPYWCTETENLENALVFGRVDSPPNVTDFQCTSQDREYLILCNWTSLSMYSVFKFYYLEGGDSFLLCKTKASNMICKWDQYNLGKEYNDDNLPDMLTFLIESCNVWGCINQTFVINRRAIVKYDPPQSLKLISKTARSAVLGWEVYPSFYVPVTYKIISEYSGYHLISVNVTLSSHVESPYYYEVELALPCPDTWYDIRVSYSNPLAEGDGYWTDEAVISVVTDPEAGNEGSGSNPTCIHRNAKLTSEVMLYELGKFRSKVREQQNEIKKQLSALKHKRDQVKEP